MSSRNVVPVSKRTHEGGKASSISKKEELSKLVMSCMLWEDTFYVDGVSIAKRIHDLAVTLDEATVREIMLQAKFGQKLRHAPLWLAVAMAERGWLKRADVVSICTRADDMTELLALYWADGKKAISKQLLRGLGDTFLKFNEYALAKYDRDRAIKLRDVLRLARPKPDSEERSALWKRVIARTLATPDTWETQLSAGKDKKATFERLLAEGTLGDLAFIRNLRKMTEVGVSEGTIIESFRNRKWSWILPFQFVTAARYNPKYEQYIEEAMLKCLEDAQKIDQNVVLLVDTSGSMSGSISGKSEANRLDVGAGLAILLREVCSRIEIHSFTNTSKLVPARRGFALRDAIGRASGSTEMWRAIRNTPACDIKIVITDEETSDSGSFADAKADLLVIINVASTSNGVGYGNKVLHINGWSENVVAFLQEYLKENRLTLSDGI